MPRGRPLGIAAESSAVFTLILTNCFNLVGKPVGPGWFDWHNKKHRPSVQADPKQIERIFKLLMHHRLIRPSRLIPHGLWARMGLSERATRTQYLYELTALGRNLVDRISERARIADYNPRKLFWLGWLS